MSENILDNTQTEVRHCWFVINRCYCGPSLISLHYLSFQEETLLYRKAESGKSISSVGRSEEEAVEKFSISSPSRRDSEKV